MPALRMLDVLAIHYGCAIVICTAAQPAFDSAHLAGGLPLAGRELPPDPQGLCQPLAPRRIQDGGEMGDDALIAAPQAMMIVNSRPWPRAGFRKPSTASLRSAG